jgi:penicillin-binding protein 2
MKNKFENRKYVVGGIVILITIIFIIQLFLLQVVDTAYKISADNNVFRYVTEYPGRGLIKDRNGKLLVYNEVAYDLEVVPNFMRAFDTLEFCRILDISKEKLVEGIQKAKMYSKYKPSVVVKQISSKKYAILQETLYKFPGFAVRTRTLRKYPEPIAAHVLGYVGEVNDKIIANDPYYKSGDYIGISGIERSYEKEVRGKKGVKIYLVDVHNSIKGSYKDGAFDTASVVGANITTTLDAELQSYGEKLMLNKIGSIVAIEPATGEILALITSPTYNSNLLVGQERTKNYQMLENDKLKPLFNRALMARYPPGSTFKLINALVGLQEGIITTNSAFSCNGGYHVGSFTVGCHHGGSIDFLHSIQGSCNSYYCNVFQRILDDKKYGKVSVAYNNWRKHLASFGIGRKLDIDLSSELSSFVPTVEYYDKIYGKDRWKSLWIISMAIGQGELGITPIHIANLTATIANRGYYITPHIIKSIEGKKSINKKYLEKHYTTIDKKHFEPVVDGMELVITSGTATRARLNGVSICGKTGTAENPHGTDHSIFVAFAPKHNPKIAIAVYIENGGFGSTWAAPIASLMIEKYLTDTISRPLMEQKMIEANLINVK